MAKVFLHAMCISYCKKKLTHWPSDVLLTKVHFLIQVKWANTAFCWTEWHKSFMVILVHPLKWLWNCCELSVTLRLLSNVISANLLANKIFCHITLWVHRYFPMVGCCTNYIFCTIVIHYGCFQVYEGI